MLEVLQDLLPFPPNLTFQESVDVSHVVNVLIFYYNLETEHSYVELDYYDLSEHTSTTVGRIYDGIFLKHQNVKGRVVIYPDIPNVDNQILPIDASRLRSFLITDYFNLTNEHFLIGLGNQDAILVFLDERLIVNVHRSGTIRISKIDEVLKENVTKLRPTLMYSKVFSGMSW